MKLRVTKPYFSGLLLLSILFLLFACSTPAWFPIKKGPPHKAKMKELLDKEVVIIDRQEYVKVLNPRFPEEGNQPRYFYIPTDEYLAKRETFATPSVRREEAKKTLPPTTTISSPSVSEREALPVSVSISPVTNLKKKVVIAHFDDYTTSGEEILGDWLAERLVKEVTQRSLQILLVDYQMVKEFLEKRGIPLSDLQTPKALRLLNEVFSIHAIVLGEFSGPYVFTTKGAREQDGTSSAIIKIEMRIVETFSGKILKKLSAQNPIIATKEKGVFSDEKAKGRAIDLILSDLSRSLTRELDGLDWFCRIAKVDGEEVYINAGRLTGLRVGDVMEVLRPGGPGERGEVKGKIQISAIFGMDASVGRLIQGKKPDENDILKLAGRGGS
ncbi:MAG: hypothetical protein QME90_04960 [Thermodesulfobacteriota bacterium]|nr:hypothetical protein [Thermodesulfobacteriota bacterium]